MIKEISLKDTAILASKVFNKELGFLGLPVILRDIAQLTAYYDNRSIFLAKKSYSEGDLNEKTKFISIDTDIGTIPFLVFREYFSTKYCISAPYDWLYSVYKKTELALSNVVKLEELPEYVNYVVGTRDNLPPTFNEYVRKYVKKDLISHFFGTKSKRIIWSLVPNGSKEVAILESIDLFRDRNLEFLKIHGNTNDYRFPIPSLEYLLNMGIALNYHHLLETDSVRVLVGTDVMKGEIVALYLGIENGGGVSFQSIATNLSPEYKPYSLILCAHLAVIREFIDNKLWDFIDFGANFEPVASYKESLRLTHHRMYGITFDSLDELEGKISSTVKGYSNV